MIKLFVSDLDGTLLSEEKKVETHNLESLAKLREQGIEICLASGRMDNEILKIAEEAGGLFHRISQNGAFVLNHGNESLYSQVFNHDLAVKLYNLTQFPDKITILCSNNTNFVEKMTDVIKDLQQYMFFPIEEKVNIASEIGKSLSPSKITVLGEFEQIAALQKELNDAFEDQIDTYISATNCLDIMPKHISKGNAIKILLDHLNLKPEEVACIGDAFNDIPMFDLTPNSFAMSEAHPDVKKHASFVVSSVSEAVNIVLEMNAAEQKPVS